MSKHHIHATHELVSENDAVISSTELRVHFQFTPGSPATGPTYASGGQPADPAEIELDYVEEEIGAGKWQRVEVDSWHWLWAETWLEVHDDRALEVVEADDERAREFAAEMRRDEP